MILGNILLKNENDILTVRQLMKQISQKLDFSYLDTVRIATVASELSRYAWEFGKKGNVQIEIIEKQKNTGLMLVFIYQSKEIEVDGKRLNKNNYVNSDSGVGLKGAKKLMDFFDIQSELEKGTTIVVKKWLRPAKIIDQEKINQLQRDFILNLKESDTSELKIQNKELVDLLEIVGKKNEQLEDLNQELEKTNSGILSLYNEIDQKNEELNLKSERKNEFMRSLGHETRTPINSIISLNRLLLSQRCGRLNEEQLTQLNMISDNAEFLLKLINDLLDHTKIEEGFQEFIITDISFKELIYKLESVLRPLAEEKKLGLSFHVSENLSALKTDFEILRHILLNILGNAIKYTDRGEVCLFIKTKFCKDCQFFEFKITDTGIGIPEDKMELIFEKFQRICTREDIQKGSGLGLAIARTLIEKLEGTVFVESVEKKGTIFTVDIPAEFSQQKEVIQPYKTKIVQSDKETILIVEDDEKLLLQLNDFMQKQGYLTQLARGPDKAIQLIKSARINLVCLDLLLPKEKDGLKILKAIKNNPLYKNIPVFITSILSQSKDMVLCLGADAFFSKPLDMHNLVDTIKKMTSKNKLESIMIIDDEKSTTYAFKKYFEMEYKVYMARDGKDALKQLESVIPDLIILDLIMPVMDGFEFMNKIKNIQMFKNIPILIYTSRELNEYEREKLEQRSMSILDKSEVRMENLPLYIKNTI